MRIFIYELKKLWNWKVILVIGVFSILTWFAFLIDALDSFDSLTKHGIYGSYQIGMFELYGETLEVEELADFGIEEKLADIMVEANTIIENEPIFAKYGVEDWKDYLERRHEEYGFIEQRLYDSMSQQEKNNYISDVKTMDVALYAPPGVTMEEYWQSPAMRFDNLKALEDRYASYQDNLESYLLHDERPIVLRSVENLLEKRNSSLISDYLCPIFSMYAATTGVFSIITVLVLVVPLLAIDRSRKVNLLQYSSNKGREIFKIQIITIISGAFFLSLLLTITSFIPFLILSGRYWKTSIMHLGSSGIWLYNLTFGQYVIILGGMIIALSISAASLAFILTRYSSNLVTMMIKAVPVGVILIGVSVLSLYNFMSDNNIIFSTVFRGRFVVPELLVCAVITALSIVAVVFVVTHEKRVDVI